MEKLDSSILCHQWLGHLLNKKLHFFHIFSSETKVENVDICDACHRAKHTHTCFNINKNES